MSPIRVDFVSHSTRSHDDIPHQSDALCTGRPFSRSRVCFCPITSQQRNRLPGSQRRSAMHAEAPSIRFRLNDDRGAEMFDVVVDYINRGLLPPVIANGQTTPVV